MAGVAVLQPQDVFMRHHNHHASLISPARKSRRRVTNPSPPNTAAAAAVNTSSSTNSPPNNHRSSPSKRRKRSPTKKDAPPLKEVNQIAPISKARATTKPKQTTIDSISDITNKLVMGQVKLLKRGEALPLQPLCATSPPDSPTTMLEKSDLVPDDEKKVVSPNNFSNLSSEAPKGSTGPQFSLRKMGFPDCYAGSAFVTSPPPSSLPVPAFFKKKNLVFRDDKNDPAPCSAKDATNDLLKLLRLDL